MNARHAAVVIVAGAAGLALLAAYRANLLSVDHEGSGAEGGDEEADAPGALDALVNSASNLVTSPTSLSDAGLDALKGYEGFSATPYVDYKGNSIGYGHLIKVGEAITVLTVDQATELLASDVAWAERAVSSAVSAPVTQEQFDALVSLCFNIGESAFRKSTLVRLLNDGDYQGAAEQFDRWNKAGGQVNQSLVRRRAAERVMFQGGTSV